MSNADDDLSSCLHRPAIRLEARIVPEGFQLTALTRSSAASAKVVNKAGKIEWSMWSEIAKLSPKLLAMKAKTAPEYLVYQTLDSSNFANSLRYISIVIPTLKVQHGQQRQNIISSIRAESPECANTS